MIVSARSRWYVIRNTRRGAALFSSRFAFVARVACRFLGATDYYQPSSQFHRR